MNVDLAVTELTHSVTLSASWCTAQATGPQSLQRRCSLHINRPASGQTLKQTMPIGLPRAWSSTVASRWILIWLWPSWLTECSNPVLRRVHVMCQVLQSHWVSKSAAQLQSSPQRTGLGQNLEANHAGRIATRLAHDSIFPLTSHGMPRSLPTFSHVYPCLVTFTAVSNDKSRSLLCESRRFLPEGCYSGCRIGMETYRRPRGGLTANISLKALLPLHVYVPLMSFVRCEALRKRSLYSCQECSEHSSNQDTSAHVRLQTAYSR